MLSSLVMPKPIGVGGDVGVGDPGLLLALPRRCPATCASASRARRCAAVGDSGAPAVTEPKLGSH